ncbi:MAG TPA: hypothetical protein DIT58_04685, partial [Porticoccaceae bacterium]|nr:hypothetical protein [Porticoccaceae bacterium]
MIGGTASEMTGGKFANGAVTGAFSQLMNNELTREKELAAQKGNSGARRAAARRAAAARGSTTMPELAEGRYLAVIDSISGELLIDIEMG